MTATRRAMVSVLCRAEGPISASVILSALSDDGVSVDRVTVYRELRFLVAHGVVSEVSVTGHPPLYELSGGHRHHLVCLGCDRIRTVPMRDRLLGEERRLESEEGFSVTGHALEFYGYCDRCR